jgi:hypothetical protein
MGRVAKKGAAHVGLAVPTAWKFVNDEHDRGQTPLLLQVILQAKPILALWPYSYLQLSIGLHKGQK